MKCAASMNPSIDPHDNHERSLDGTLEGPASVYSLAHVSNDELHAGARRLVGRSNQLLAALVAHLAEVEARGIHRERSCASVTTYCVYELRLSEDAAFRRARAARIAREFPVVLEHLAAGEIHLTALLLLGPHLTEQNHRELLALSKHRTKREVLRLIRRLDPAPDVPALVEPLGPAPLGVPVPRAPSWQAFFEALSPPVRELPPGDNPKDWITSAPADNDTDIGSDGQTATPQDQLQDQTPPEHAATEHAPSGSDRLQPSAPERFKVQFTASQEYVDLLQEARDLASHALPSGSLEQLHLQAMRLLVAQLKKRRCATLAQPRVATPTPRPRESRQHADEPGTPRQHADEPGAPRQRGGDTEVARQRDTGTPRQRGTDAPRQHADEPGTPRQRDTGAPRQRGSDTAVARQHGGETGAPRQRKPQPEENAGAPRQHGGDMEVARQDGGETGAPRQRGTDAPRQRGSDTAVARQHGGETGAPRQRGTDAPRQRGGDTEVARQHADKPGAARQRGTDAPRQSEGEPGAPRQREHVPRRVQRLVWSRDGARCTYVDNRGVRCRETAFLQLHHLEPHGRGGPTTADNLALRCHAHNALAAEQDFGRSFVQTKRSAEAGPGRRRRASVSGIEKASG